MRKKAIFMLVLALIFSIAIVIAQQSFLTPPTTRTPETNPTPELEPEPAPSASPASTESATPNPTPEPKTFPLNSTEARILFLLRDVIGIDVDKYQMTLETNSQTDFLGSSLVEDDYLYRFSSEKSMLRFFCTFVNGTLYSIGAVRSDTVGEPQVTRNGTTTEIAKQMVLSYQVYTGNPEYAMMAAFLNHFTPGENCSQTQGNMTFEATYYSSSEETLSWFFTYNGLDAKRKCFFLTFRDGFFDYFADGWSLFRIGSTDQNLTEDEARSMAIKLANNRTWALQNHFTGWSISDVAFANLGYATSLTVGVPHGDDPLAYYLVWRIGVSYQNMSEYVKGLIIDFWADTKQFAGASEFMQYMPS